MLLIESPRKKASDTPGMSKAKTGGKDDDEDDDDDNDDNDDNDEDEEEDEDEDDTGDEGEEGEDNSGDLDEQPSANEKEVIRRAIQHTVTVVATESNSVRSTVRPIRRSGRLNAGKLNK